MSGAILEARQLGKRFGPIEALADVDVSIRPGEVHALAGENGAGKSTLLKAFAGVHAPTSGEMRLAGNHYAPNSVGEARSHGIGVVFQETTLQPRLTVAENLAGASYSGLSRGPFLSWRRIRYKAAERLAATGVDVPLEAPAESLTLGQQRIVELTAALAGQPRVLLVDEITASLDAVEVRAFFKVVHSVVEQGTALVYVSHHLEEIFELCDRVTVLRDGHVIGTEAVRDMDEARLTSMMVGRQISHRDVAAQLRPRSGGKALELTGLTLEGHFEDVSLAIAPGEIVGLAGLQGSGPETLLETVFGLHHANRGTMRLFGEDYSPRGPRQAVRRGVGYIPKERDLEGAITAFTARRNMTLPIVDRLARRGFITTARERSTCQPLIEAVGLRPPDDDVRCDALSGGNRQKVVIAKWLASEPRLLVLNNPTRGVDVGAKDEIYQLLASLAADGMALLIASEELPELLGLCSRVVVMRRGRVTREFGVGAERTEDALVEQML